MNTTTHIIEQNLKPVDVKDNVYILVKKLIIKIPNSKLVIM